MSGHTKKIQFIAMLAISLCLLLPAGAFAQQVYSREYPYLYKSTRAMGMGGAYTAIGGRADTLFYNPAGLDAIPRDKGWEINGFPLIIPLNISVEGSKNAIDFFKDLSDATSTGTDAEQQKAVNEVLAQYRGENLHLRIADFPSIAKSFEKISFGIGGLGSARIDAVAHQGFGPEGLLEMNADLTYGAIAGMSYSFTDNVTGGLGVKVMHRELLVHDFTSRELVAHQNNLDSYILDDLRKSGDAVGFDAGVMWKIAPDSWWRPTAGLSLLNIGDLDFKDAGKIPMSVNAGFAVNPQITWFRNLVLGLDYVDVTKQFTEDKDVAKRIRYGAELQMFDTIPMELTLRAGMYEGSPTAGLDFRLLIFTLSGTMYTEEIGAYKGQDKDKRYLVTLNVGW